MPPKANVIKTLKLLLVKQVVLRWFTAICVAAITGMSGIILFLLQYWAGQMSLHTDQLNTVIAQNSSILQHQIDTDRRLTEDRDDIRALAADDLAVKLWRAKLEGRD